MDTKATEAPVPQHIGFILDGNRRWATANGLPKFEGHRAGFDNLKAIAEEAFDRGVTFVTAFVFSTENWNRAKEEVGYLMDLAHRMITKHLQESYERGMRLVWIGSPAGVNDKLVKALYDAEEKTKHNKKGTLGLCFNYGGQQEIVDATRRCIEDGLRAEEIDQAAIAQRLYAPAIPPIDLLVRTSGEQRLSNFMLWRVAYSELLFLDKYWPDMTTQDLDDVIQEYNRRTRRFGS